MRVKKYYIKERRNPQLGTYFVAEGAMSKAAAKRKESSLYGDNYMHSFNTEAEYNARLAELRAAGESVQS